MADYINRQTAIESIKECADAADDNREWDMAQGYLNAIECLEEEPDADVVEVVRCKDCNDYQMKYRWCGFHEREMEPTDFCSYGERKDDKRRRD